MPWQNQGGPWGGGPWGGGGSGGRGGGSGGIQPPDLEELIRRLQVRFRRLMPGGFGSGRGIMLIALLVILVWALSGFYRVQPDEQGVVLRFGRWTATTTPGLNYHLPWPIEHVETPKVTRVNRIEIGFRSGTEQGRGGLHRELPEESLMLTGDENIVDVNFSVFWVIKDAGQFLFNVRNQEATVKAVAESMMREVIGRTPIATALAEGRGQIETDVRRGSQAILDRYQAGIEVTQVQLQKVDPPAQVVDAFRDVQRARADADRSRNDAQAYANDIVPRARGDAARVEQEAEAYKQQVIAKAEGEARRFDQVYAAYAKAKDVTATRLYLDAMTDVLKRARKVLVDGKVGMQNVLPYLRLPEPGAPHAPAGTAPSDEGTPPPPPLGGGAGQAPAPAPAGGGDGR